MQNDNTVHALDLVAPRPLPVRDAFRRAWPQILNCLDSEERCDYVLAAVTPSSVEAIPIAVDGPGDWPVDRIVGRHTSCSVVLRDDPAVALRQLLLRFYRESGGALRVRALDLQTTDGFIDENGVGHRSLLSNRHLFIRFASVHLLMLRNDGRAWRPDPDDAWHALPPRHFLDAQPVTLDDDAENPSLRSRFELADAPATEDSVVTATAASSYLDTAVAVLGSAVPATSGSPLLGSLSMPSSPDNLIHLSAEQLAGGVLMGRYPRCQVDTFNLDPDTGVSRVHVCLLLDETGLWIIDTGSTNGTRIMGDSVQTYRLGRYLRFSLGEDFELIWQMQPTTR